MKKKLLIKSIALAREYAKSHMPDFDDGRIEFLEENFNK